MEKQEQKFNSFPQRDICMYNKLPETMSDYSVFSILNFYFRKLLPFFYFQFMDTENCFSLPFSILSTTLCGA